MNRGFQQQSCNQMTSFFGTLTKACIPVVDTESMVQYYIYIDGNEIYVFEEKQCLGEYLFVSQLPIIQECFNREFDYSVMGYNSETANLLSNTFTNGMETCPMSWNEISSPYQMLGFSDSVYSGKCTYIHIYSTAF